MALKLIHDSRLDSVATIRTEVEQNFDQIHFQVCLWVQGWLSPPATPPTLTTPLPSPPSSSTTSTWERPRWGRGLICRGETATLITSQQSWWPSCWPPWWSTWWPCCPLQDGGDPEVGVDEGGGGEGQLIPQPVQQRWPAELSWWWWMSWWLGWCCWSYSFFLATTMAMMRRRVLAPISLVLLNELRLFIPCFCSLSICAMQYIGDMRKGS